MKKTIILAIHGLGGRGAWFDNLRHSLENFDIQFISPDLAGFGNNKPRGHISSFHEWVDHIQRLYSELKHDNPDTQIVLLGHSMGAVVLSHIEVSPEDKLIYSVPGFKGAKATFKLSFTIQTLLRLVRDKFLTHKYSLIRLPSSKLDKHITDEDPLKVYDVSPNLLWQILLMSQNLKTKFAHMRNKVLFIQVKNDLVVDNQTMEEFFNIIPSETVARKEFLTLETNEHDWIWESETVTKAVSRIIQFIEQPY